jgi:hypothetical protein
MQPATPLNSASHGSSPLASGAGPLMGSPAESRTLSHRSGSGSGSAGCEASADLGWVHAGLQLPSHASCRKLPLCAASSRLAAWRRRRTQTRWLMATPTASRRATATGCRRLGAGPAPSAPRALRVPKRASFNLGLHPGAPLTPSDPRTHSFIGVPLPRRTLAAPEAVTTPAALSPGELRVASCNAATWGATTSPGGAVAQAQGGAGHALQPTQPTGRRNLLPPSSSLGLGGSGPPSPVVTASGMAWAQPRTQGGSALPWVQG